MKIMNYFKTEKKFQTNFEQNLFTKYLPLILCGGFYAMTIFLFVVGPYDWHISNPVQLYSFLILTMVVLFAGYYIGINTKNKGNGTRLDLNKIIYLSFAVFIILYLFTLYSTTGKFYPDIIMGLLDSGRAYRLSHAPLSNFGKIIYYISILLSPVTVFLIPTTYLYFKSLNIYAKIFGISAIILTLCLGISQGIINTYANTVFLFSFVWIIYLFSTKNKKGIKHFLLGLFILVIVVSSFFLYYKTVMSNRLKADTEKPNIMIKDHSKAGPSINNTIQETEDIFNESAQFSIGTLKEKSIYSWLPDEVEGSLNHLTSYLTHGYKGLSLAMEEQFTSSYGLGFSDFFRHNFLKLTNQSDKEDYYYGRTYMGKIEKTGWVTGEVWSSFFIYPASDIGFIGTIILVFLIGFVFAKSWKDTIVSNNLFASMVFLQCCIIVCFFSANNLTFQMGGTFISTIVMMVLWNRSQINKKEKNR